MASRHAWAARMARSPVNSARGTRRICIIQPVMKQYRVPFFLALDRALAEYGITLEVVYGSPWAEEAARGDNVDLPAPLGRRVPTWRLFRSLSFQPVLRPWLRADLVVLEHANKHALNHLLTALRAIGCRRLAYWGHGRDRQADADTWGERFKRRSLHWADWWFSYTAAAAAYVTQQGFPAERVTVVENAVDTRTLRNELAAVTGDELRAARAKLGWHGGERVAVFCGSMYPSKRLDLLFAAAARAHQAVPELRLLIIGGGPLTAEAARLACEHRDWARYVGPKFGRDKTVLLKLAEFWLNPGLIGLGILDAFCAELPVLTTALAGHGPEIEYLQDGANGLIVAPDVADFSAAIIRLLGDRLLLERLRAGAASAARRYSIETMVGNFVEGVRRSLALS